LAAEKGVKMFSQLHYSPYFCTSSLLSHSQREIRAGKLLVDPGHLQEELEGGRPHHRYRRARRRRPGVDRVLQKTHILLMTMQKNNVKQLYVALRICFLTHLVCFAVN
jgi:hypothetical protein